MPIHKTVNVKFFKKWTPKMAYILGFFAADGNMLKNKRGAYFIEFNTIDRKLLEGIKNALGSNHKISFRKRSNKWKTSYRLQIGSKAIFNDLTDIGYVPNKSRRIDLPKMSPRYLSHFTRGYFDGDGHVCISRYVRKNRNNKKARIIISGFTSCAKEFLENLHFHLKKFANIFGGSLFYKKGYRLSFSIKDSLALYKFLYESSDNNLYLARKKKVFEKYFNLGP
jgi:intein-encoded DNA endonuclease-like protein